MYVALTLVYFFIFQPFEALELHLSSGPAFESLGILLANQDTERFSFLAFERDYM